MEKTLYLAPMNHYTNKVFRHICLKNGADSVFSELIMCDRITQEKSKKKHEIIPGDEKRTVIQIGASTEKQIEKGVKLAKKVGVREVNLNMGCPHSSMQLRKVCSGILYDKKLMEKLSLKLSQEAKENGLIPSVKLRLGLSAETIEINDYINILKRSEVKKIYVHARTLRHPYNRPVLKLELDEKSEGIEIIYNGDIDSYEKTKDKNFSGIMIGRAAICNPLIFKQIKNKEKEGTKAYEPARNDTSIIHEKGESDLSKEKQELIEEYLFLAKKYKLTKNVILQNLSQMLLGLTKKAEFLRRYQEQNL